MLHCDLTFFVDIWAIGCIFAELLRLHALFPGEEVKGTSNAPVLQVDQLQKIFSVLGTPSVHNWPDLAHLPHWPTVAAMPQLQKYDLIERGRSVTTAVNHLSYVL